MAHPADCLSAGWGTSHDFPLFSSIMEALEEENTEYRIST